MNPTGRLKFNSSPFVLGALALLSALGALTPARAADSPMPRPAELERDVQFWIRVYTEFDTNSGVLHDQYNLGVVYETLHFAPDTPPRERQREVDNAREAPDRSAQAHRRQRRCAALTRGPADQGPVGGRRHAGAPARGDRGHPLPARAIRPLPCGPDPLGRLGDAHRRDAREPGAAARAGGAAARGVILQSVGLLQGRRRGPVAVHALDRSALHAHRQRGRRPARSVPLHRGRRAAAGLQLPPARQLAARAHRLQPRHRRHAARQGGDGDR